MRDAENIRDVELLKPDLMGFICWQGSKRNVASAPLYLPRCTRVGVFVNPDIEYVLGKVKQLKLNLIQLHGDESSLLCKTIHEQTGLPIIKAISISNVQDLQKAKEYEGEACIDRFLFDTKCDCVGGCGVTFDWNILQEYRGNKHFLLAGGIDIEHAASIKALYRSIPQMDGVDLNSRFELSPAIKDIEKLKRMIELLRE